MGKKIRVSVVEKEDIFKEIPMQYLDDTKIRSLGWKPLYTVRNGGAEHTIEWYTKVFSAGVK